MFFLCFLTGVQLLACITLLSISLVETPKWKLPRTRTNKAVAKLFT